MKKLIDINKKFISRLLIIVCVVLVIQNRSFIESHYTFLSCPASRQAGNKNIYRAEAYEDYILSIVFEDVANGLYIDIGGNSPAEVSGSIYFYRKGWKGMNIEPNEKWFDVTIKETPNAINLNVGISNKEAEVETFYFKDGSSLSTLDPEFAEGFKKEMLKNNKPYKSIKVPMLSLNKVLEDNHFNQVVNFIKIEVYGEEKEVLEGIDFKKFRPQVFSIYSTKPNASISSNRQWEHIILENGYEFAMFDGLYRYYLAKEHHVVLAPKFHKAMRCTKASNFLYGNSDLILGLTPDFK